MSEHDEPARRPYRSAAEVPPVFEIQGLHVEVAGIEILKGVDLTIEAGQVAALMGPRGSRKSTLANTLLAHPAYPALARRIR